MITLYEFERLCDVFNDVYTERPDIAARDIGDYIKMIRRGEI